MLWKRDRLITLTGLLGVAALAWVYVAYSAIGRMSMEAVMPDRRAWSAADFGVTFALWAVMMAAMMLPTVAPAALVFSSIHRQRHDPRAAYALTALFALGYLAVWMGFGAAATLAQWGLRPYGGLSVSGIILMAAGIFQWTPLKHACLAHCRSPQGFFMTEWREGAAGAFRMGGQHGLYCLGCCWLLMALLLASGAMNLLWMAALTAFILAEKIIPAGRWLSRLVGFFLIAGGLWLLLFH
jgi:predicted metal-binding membrane protein